MAAPALLGRRLAAGVLGTRSAAPALLGRRLAGVLAAGALVASAGTIAACGSSESDSSGGAGAANSAGATANTPLNKLFGPGGKDAGQGVTINDGMLLAVTGAGSFYGDTMSKAAKLAAKQIEQAGGPSFDIKIGDHKSGEIPAGVAATRQLVTQNKLAIMQTSFGPVSEAIIPLIQQKQILTFQGGGTTPGQLGKDFLYNNRMVFGDEGAPGAIAWLAKAYPKAKRLAIVGTPENAVPAQTKIIPELWPKLSNGGTIVARESHDVGITDFSGLVARIRAAKPDAIWNGDYGNDTAGLMKALDQAGLKDIPVVGLEYTPQACELGGAAYNHFIPAGDSFDPDNKNPFTQEFVKSFKSAYGRIPEVYSANYYEQLFIVWELVRRTIKNGGDPTKGADLQKSLLENPTFKSVYGGGAGEVGEIKLDPTKHNVIKPMSVNRVQPGCKLKKVADIQTLAQAGGDPAKTLVKITGK